MTFKQEAKSFQYQCICSSWCYVVLCLDLTFSIVLKQHWKRSSCGLWAIQEEYGWSCAKFMDDSFSDGYIFSLLKASFSVFQPFQVPQPEKKPHIPRWSSSGEETLNPNHLSTFFAFFALFFFTLILKKNDRICSVVFIWNVFILMSVYLKMMIIINIRIL